MAGGMDTITLELLSGPPKRSSDHLFGVILVVTLALFIGAGMYLTTVKPLPVHYDEKRITQITTQFVVPEKKKPPAPKPKPVASKQETVDLTKAPLLNQKQDFTAPQTSVPQTMQVARPVYGLRRVYSTGITSFEGLDDAHASAAARTGREPIGRLCGLDRLWRRRRRGQQLAGAGDVGLACRAGEQSVVPDAMKAERQDMQQEAAHELVGIERHDLLALRAAAAVILVGEGHAGLIEGNQAAVRDRDPVRVAGQIGEHRFGAGEWRLGIDHPSLLPDPSEMTQEKSVVGETGLGAEEGKLSGPM